MVSLNCFLMNQDASAEIKVQAGMFWHHPKLKALLPALSLAQVKALKMLAVTWSKDTLCYTFEPVLLAPSKWQSSSLNGKIFRYGKERLFIVNGPSEETILEKRDQGTFKDEGSSYNAFRNPHKVYFSTGALSQTRLGMMLLVLCWLLHCSISALQRKSFDF